MNLFLQNVINGLSSGSVYALVAIGLVLVYRSSGVLNFAHGTLAVLATFVAFEAARAGISMGLAMAAGLAFAFAFGAGIYRGLLERARAGGPHAVVMASIAILMILEGLMGVLWGTDTKEFHHYFREAEAISITRDLVVPRHDLWIIGIAALLAILLAAFFRWTAVGIGLRAIADNPTGARLMGLEVPRLEAVAWGLASALAAAAGLLVVPRLFLDPTMMFGPMLKAFAAAVLGGITSVVGALIGGWLLGIIETLTGAYLSTEFQATISLVIIVLVLCLRPAGLCGKR